MVLEVPSWLTKKFIKNALEKNKNFTVEIESMEVDIAVP